MSIFSTLSNLIDLSFDDDYAMMLGYTEAELDEYFSDRMHIQAEKMGMTYEAYRAELRRNYNGYRFWKLEGENVYNPVSINLDLAKAGPEFEYYWSKTGRSSMLMNILKRGDLLAIDPERVMGVSDEILEVNESAPNPIAVMYLEGYLTRTDYDPRSKMYRLGIPNEEIRRELRERYSVTRAEHTSSS